MVSRKRTTFSADYKAEAVRMVIDESRPIARVAADLGIDDSTLGGWVTAYRRESHREESP